MSTKVYKNNLKNVSWPVSYKKYDIEIRRIAQFILDLRCYFYKRKKSYGQIFYCIEPFLMNKIYDHYEYVNSYRFKKNSFIGIEKELLTVTSRNFKIKDLKNGLKEKNILFKYLRYLKNFKNYNNFHYKPMNLIYKDKMNIVISNNELIKSYLNKIKKKFYVFPLSEWFYPCSKKEYLKNKKERKAYILNFILEKLENLFLKINCDFKKEKKLEFKNFISQVIFWIGLYLNRLDSIKDKLPKHLLTGTLGIVWSRILSVSVKKNGGKVYSFDHAAGAHTAIESLKMFTEGGISDCFYTYNKSHKEYYCKSYQKLKNKFLNSKIKIAPIIKKNKVNKICKNSNKREILLMAPPFFLNCGIPRTTMPPLIQFDWHLKLIYYLKNIGYNVTYKPHPTSNKIIVKKLCKIADVKYEIELFERIYHKYSVIIFDCRATTSWSHALKTNKPIIFIDFLFYNYTNKDISLLKKRVSYIKGKFNKLNVPYINFEDLKKIILNANKLKNNTSFVNSFIY